MPVALGLGATASAGKNATDREDHRWQEKELRKKELHFHIARSQGELSLSTIILVVS